MIRNASMPGVIEKIDFLVRFWELKARRESCGDPLAASEQVELLSLMQLMTVDRKVQGAWSGARAKRARSRRRSSAMVRLSIEIRNVTAAAAILVAAASVFSRGARRSSSGSPTRSAASSSRSLAK